MNSLRLTLVLESSPSEDCRAEIEAEMRSFLSQFAPHGELVTMSGEGSWWITAQTMAYAAGGWLALQFASWTAKKGLDALAERLGQKLNQRTSDCTSTPLALEGRAAEASAGYQALVALTDFALRMKEMADRLDSEGLVTTSILFGEWSETVGIGRIVSLRREQSEVSLSLIQIDSSDEFNSRTLGGRMP